MLKHRWNRFMCPNGIRRRFNPRKWEQGTPVLVFGELIALCSALAAIPGWTYSRWFLYAAAIIGSGALAWYALDKSSLGEMPLTGTSAKRIANVVHLVNTEEKLGRVVQWDTISADGERAKMDATQMKPEVKILMAKNLVKKRLEAIGLESVLEGPWDESIADMVLERFIDDETHVSVPTGEADETQA